MPRLGLISDVHANLPALQAVLACLDQAGADTILCAGDLAGAPNLDETVALFLQRGIISICGNNDTALIQQMRGRAAPERYTARQFALVRWNAAHTSQASLEFLESLRDETVFGLPGMHPIHIAHGSPGEPTNGLDPEDINACQEAARKSRAPLLLTGHSHRLFSRQVSGVTICNPGSVCGPLDGTTAAQYALADWDGQAWQVSLHAVPYDLNLIRQAFTDSGLLAEGGPLARTFLLSIQTGRDATLDFLDHARRLAGSTVPWIPDEVWEQAEKTYPWPDNLPASVV